MACLFMVAFLFPATMFSWFGFSTARPEDKVDFACPHHCGQWGTESIQAIEWRFVQCLYEANKLQKFIEANLREIKESPSFRIVIPNFTPKPERFQSKWYQKMISNNSYPMVIQDGWECYSDWAVFWKIKHIDRENGQHLGKVFERAKYEDCGFEEIDSDDEDDDECTCDKLVEQGKYSFTNRIDFNNACMQIERDMWDSLQDRKVKDLEDVENIALFKSKIQARFGKLSSLLQEVKNSYDKIFEECRRAHHAPSADYELILKQFEKGDYVDAIDELKALLNRVNLDSLDAHLASHIYSSKGNAEIETLQYDEAILSISHAIKLNASNPDLYFERAVAYFETGQFDLSFHDYLEQRKDVSFKAYSGEFDFSGLSKGFAMGGIRGVKEASTEFLPSIYNSVSGVGNFLWLTVQHPIDTPKQLIRSVSKFCNYLRECDKAELAKLLVPEMYELVDKWDALTHKRRGELLGYSLGKYGLDILLPVAAVKGLKYVKTFQEIKRAEKLCIFQTLSKSPESNKALTQAAVKWKNQREASFANVKLVKDQQNKHIVGSHNYQPGKGKWEHPEPEALLYKHAGKGQKVAGEVGQPGYRERIDFGEFIGYYESDKIAKPVPTTVGVIHYSKKGAHIVPAAPKK